MLLRGVLGLDECSSEGTKDTDEVAPAFLPEPGWVWGLGVGVWGLGFGVLGLGLKGWGLGFGVWLIVALDSDLVFRVQGFVERSSRHRV